MSLPFSRNESYVDGETPIPAQTMNDIQDLIVSYEKIVRGSDFWLQDDFTGSAVDTGQWKTTGTFAPIDDHSSDGLGAIDLSVSSGGDHDQRLYTQPMKIGTRDYYFAARVRMATLGATGDVRIGITDAGSGTSRFFLPEAGGTNWFMNVATVQDSGVAFTPTVYQLLEFSRIDGVFEMKIDGVQVYTEANVASLANSVVDLHVEYDANTISLVVDMVKFWVGR